MLLCLIKTNRSSSSQCQGPDSKPSHLEKGSLVIFCIFSLHVGFVLDRYISYIEYISILLTLHDTRQYVPFSFQLGLGRNFFFEGEVRQNLQTVTKEIPVSICAISRTRQPEHQCMLRTSFETGPFRWGT